MQKEEIVMQEEASPIFQYSADSPFQALDFETLSALQAHNIEALRRISAVVLEASNIIAKRHTDYLASSRDQAAHWFDEGQGTPGIDGLAEQRAALYSEFSNSLARHTEGLMEITLKCCGDVLQQFGENITEQSESTAKCCCGTSHDEHESDNKEANAGRSKKPSRKTHDRPIKSAVSQ